MTDLNELDEQTKAKIKALYKTGKLQDALNGPLAEVGLQAIQQGVAKAKEQERKQEAGPKPKDGESDLGQ